MNPLKASWRTTVGGIVVFLSVLFGQLKAEFDSDDSTKADWNQIVAAAGVLYALLNARDNIVTSEKAGAK